MDIKKLTIFIFLMTSISFCYSDTLNDYEYLKLSIVNDIEFGINFESEYSINEFELSSYFFTQTFQNSQYLNSFDSTKNEYQLINDSGILHLKYAYNGDSLKQTNKIQNEFILESTTFRPEIKTKQIYPIAKEKIEEINSTYLEFFEFIDTNNQIKKQASKIAEGEDDVYIISSKIAKWIIENVEYDLNTVFENPNQKSSEVFTSQEGVCREITNLFISMLRSIGIPARVSIGYSYTESQELVDFVGSNWGGHAWAEVLIGDIWVPFDLTYNQYGYVDATHITTDKFHTIRPRSLSVRGTGYGFDIQPNSLTSKPEFEVLEKLNKKTESGFDLEVTGTDILGFGSYGYLKLDITNSKDYYQLLFLKFAMPEEVEVLDLKEKMYVFEPNEKREVYFRFQIPENLNPKLVYTFPFTIYNEFIEETLNIDVRESHLSIKEIALPEEKEKDTILSNNELSANCNFILDIPKNLVICSLKNPNNYETNNVQVCFEEECKKIDIKVGSFETATFETNKKEGKFSFTSKQGSSEFNLNAVIPKLTITNSKDNETRHVDLNIKIEDYINELKLNYYINEKLNKTIDPEEFNYKTLILDYGQSEIKIDLTFNDEIIDTYNQKIFFKEKTKWEKFVEWFLELIEI